MICSLTFSSMFFMIFSSPNNQQGTFISPFFEISHWYGDNFTMAIHVDQLLAARLGGAVVFAANCHLPETPMLDALLKAGARAVAGGHGANWADKDYVAGADFLGLWFRRWLQLGLSPALSLKLAKIRLNLNAFMMGLFRQGAFQGSTPNEAFYVKCDAETTTQADRNLGIVNIEVGFAPLKPAEFVVIKIQQIAGDL